MEIRSISNLESQMTVEQKAESKADFEKFYSIPFGKLNPINCSSEKNDSFLRQVDLNDFE